MILAFESIDVSKKKERELEAFGVPSKKSGMRNSFPELILLLRGLLERSLKKRKIKENKDVGCC